MKYLLVVIMLSMIILVGCSATESEMPVYENGYIQEDDGDDSNEVDAVMEENNDSEMKENEDSEMKDSHEQVMIENDFAFTDFDGNEILLSDYYGEKVYVKAWASWCPICLAGLEEFNELSGNDKDITVLSVVFPDRNGELSKDEFIEWYNGLEGYDNIVVLFDDEDGSFLKEMGIRGMPTSLYFSSKLEIEKTIPGHNSNEDIYLHFQSID